MLPYGLVVFGSFILVLVCVSDVGIRFLGKLFKE